MIKHPPNYEQLFKDIADLDFQEQYHVIQAYADAHRSCGYDRAVDCLATDDNFIRWAVRNYDNIMNMAHNEGDYKFTNMVRRPNAV